MRDGAHRKHEPRHHIPLSFLTLHRVVPQVIIMGYIKFISHCLVFRRLDNTGFLLLVDDFFVLSHSILIFKFRTRLCNLLCCLFYCWVLADEGWYETGVTKRGNPPSSPSISDLKQALFSDGIFLPRTSTLAPIYSRCRRKKSA